MSLPVTDEAAFDKLLKEKLGDLYPRALIAFQNWGKALAYDVLNVLLHSADQGKTEEVLGKLEAHWREHLQFQHPEIQGQVTGSLGINPTQELLLDICKRVLHLQPSGT